MSKRTISDIYEEMLIEKENMANAEIRLYELQDELKKKEKRKERYWQNKEEENIRSKIWRLQQKLDKIIEEKEDKKYVK